jgi:serine/threonine protein kinase, bacterial
MSFVKFLSQSTPAGPDRLPFRRRRPSLGFVLIALAGTALTGCGSAHTIAVSTLAGNGRAGFRDGAASTAEFGNPSGLAVDAAGNVYVSDNLSSRVRMIGADSHIVSTIAGSGATGFANGAPTRAEFNHPTGIAVDRSGNVYVADTNNEAIRMIAAGSRSVTTLAGDGMHGFRDGVALAARFNSPMGVAVDSAGNVFVADAGNDRIRMIAAGSHEVSTVAGSTAGFADGAAGNAEFDHPIAVAVDSAGNLFVADVNNNRIRIISAGSRGVSTLAGGGRQDFADGEAMAAEFSHPVGVAVDPVGNVYVADSLNARVRVISVGSHLVSTLAGSGTTGSADGPGESAQFASPFAVAVNRGGSVYVADLLGQRIRLIAKRSK